MNNRKTGPGAAGARRRLLPAARLLIAALGAFMLLCGILQGGYRDTLQKAVRICLECVGIG